jgi:hypothetical protein
MRRKNIGTIAAPIAKPARIVTTTSEREDALSPTEKTNPRIQSRGIAKKTKPAGAARARISRGREARSSVGGRVEELN